MVRRRQRNHTAIKTDRSHLLRLLVLALLFSAGVILGQVLSRDLREQTSGELTRYLTDFFSVGLEADGTGRVFLSAVWIYFRYPLLVFLMGLSSVGVALIPVLTMAYGFFLSFSVCCFTAAFGGGGVLLALSVFGLRCLITLPCYFSLAIPALRKSLELAALSLGRGRRTSPTAEDSGGWLRLCTVSAILLAGVLSEVFLSPYLLRLVLEKILI